MNIAEENKLNEVGDKIAKMLGMRVDTNATPDSQGRTRWKTAIGNETGIGLIRSIESFVSEEIKRLKKA